MAALPPTPVAPAIFDRTLLRARLARAAQRSREHFLLARAAEDLADRLAPVLRRFGAVLDCGSPGPAVADALVRALPDAVVTRLQTGAAGRPQDDRVALVTGDEERLPFGPGRFDLAVSCLALQSVNDLPGALIQMRRALKPDGLFLACLLGGQTLTELRSVLAAAESEVLGGASPRVAPFADLRDLGGLLQRAGFALPVTDTDPMTVRYDSVFGLMADLRAMGLTNVLAERRRQPTPRAVMLRAAELYAARFADPDGRVRATFELVWLSGWAPHESQQKPLQPGSARMRLADALAAVRKEPGRVTDRPDPDAADGLPAPRRYVAAAAVLAAIVLAVLDGAIANVALPTMAVALHVPAASAVWIVTGYQVALVVALLPFAALGESIGCRRVFVGGVAAFTLASGLCALAPTLPILIAARMLQGLGAAAVMSMLAALLRHTYPLRMLGTALGLNALVVGLSSAAGPTLGAGILSVAPWPWLFAVNIPIGLIVLAVAAALPRTIPTHRRIDVVSVALNAGFFAPLVLGVDVLASRPAAGVAALAGASVSLTLLARREAPRPAPLIPLDLLRAATFRLSVMGSVCIFAAQMLSFVALPFYLQHGLGLSPLQTGLYMTPWPLTVAMAAPIAGKLADRVAPALLCALGGGAMALGLTLAAAWPLAHHPGPLVAFTILSGLGFGFFQTPNNRTMLLAVPKARSGAAGGMQATARQFGQSVGSVLTAILLAVVPTTAPRLALATGAALAAAAGLISVLKIEGRRTMAGAVRPRWRA